MNLGPVEEMYSEFYFVNTVYIFILTSHCTQCETERCCKRLHVERRAYRGWDVCPEFDSGRGQNLEQCHLEANPDITAVDSVPGRAASRAERHLWPSEDLKLGERSPTLFLSVPLSLYLSLSPSVALVWSCDIPMLYGVSGVCIGF